MFKEIVVLRKEFGKYFGKVEFLFLLYESEGRINILYN